MVKLACHNPDGCPDYNPLKGGGRLSGFFYWTARMKPKCWAHPKFSLLQQKLNIGPALAAGILEGLWHLAATFDDEGGRIPYSEDELVAWMGVDIAGDELLGALVACRWLDETERGLIVHDWHTHRPRYVEERVRIRNKRQPLPTVANSCQQSAPSASASVLKETKTIVRSKQRTTYSEDFCLFWGNYPPGGRRDKRKAYKAFIAATERAEIDIILAAAKEYAGCGKVRAGFCRLATTWLNSDAWEDDRAGWVAGGKAGDNGNDPMLESRRRIERTRKLLDESRRGE